MDTIANLPMPAIEAWARFKPSPEAMAERLKELAHKWALEQPEDDEIAKVAHGLWENIKFVRPDYNMVAERELMVFNEVMTPDDLIEQNTIYFYCGDDQYGPILIDMECLQIEAELYEMHEGELYTFELVCCHYGNAVARRVLQEMVSACAN